MAETSSCSLPGENELFQTRILRPMLNVYSANAYPEQYHIMNIPAQRNILNAYNGELKQIETILKTTEADYRKLNSVHRRNVIPCIKQPFKQAKSKRFSSFMIEEILKPDNNKKKSTDSPKLYQFLSYMDILNELRHKRLQKYRQSLAKMTECLLCGGCSFSQSETVAANYMAQHLYTHLSHSIYSCSLCPHYRSSWKPRVQSHLRKQHPFVARNNYSTYIADHRPELDDKLSQLAMQCYGV